MVEFFAGAAVFMVGVMTGWSLFKQAYIVGTIEKEE